MAISAAVLDAMVKAGCSAEQLLAVVKADEAAEKERLAEKREKTRIRVQKHRARNASNALQSDVTRYTPAPSDGLPPEPPNPLTPPTPHSPPTGAHIPPTPTARNELASVLDDVHVSAVLDHRQKIRKPLTAHAAHLLAAKFAACPDPNAAADAMVANGWQGFEPAWMEDRTRNRAQGPPAQRNGMLAALERKLKREHDHDGPQIEASDNGRYQPGTGQAVLSFAPPKRDG